MKRKYYRRKTAELGEVLGKSSEIDEILSMPEGEQDYYIPLPGYKLKTLTTIGPGLNYHQLDQITLDFFEINNDLLLYRLLKDLFGPADIITAYYKINTDAKVSLIPFEWGYTFKPPSEMSEFFYIEIQKRTYCSRPYLIVWILSDHDYSDNERRKIADFVKEFLQDLNEHISKNKFLFNESEKKGAQSAAVINVFAEKYEAGNILFAHAKEFDTSHGYNKIKIGEKIGIFNTGTLYLAAATYYLIALEGYANMVLELLLKPEFRDKLYRRATFEADLDIRLLSLPLYCIGFAKQGLTNKSAAYKKLWGIRDFRNQIFHNNITEFHRIYVLKEDHYQFYFDPMTDKPILSSGNSINLKLPTRREQVGREHVEFIKRTVDEIVHAIIDSMAGDYKGWATKWLHNPAVPVEMTKDGQWHPTLDTTIE
jgi:hypothetical protein